MEAVDILCHDRLEFSGFLPGRQLLMCLVRLHAGCQQLIPVEFEELLRVRPVKGVRQHGLGRIFVLLVIEPVLAAEIRDTGLRGDTGSAEEHDVVTLVRQFL